MKKLFLVSVVLILAFGVFVSGCDEAAEEVDLGEEDLDDPLAGYEEFTLTFAHADPTDPDQYAQRQALAFKEYVEDRTGGRITVEISGGGALGTIAEIAEQTITGELQISSSHTEGTLALIYPNIQVVAIPYLFESVDHGIETFRGEFGEEMFEDMRQQTGVRVLGLFDNGMRNFTNSVRPIRTPADMGGLRIRTMDIPAHMQIVESLGGSATPIAWTELYSALETGVVEGQENANATIILGSIYEVQDYLTLDGHVYSQNHTIVNDEWFQGLPLRYQQIIEDGVKYSCFVAQMNRRVAEDTALEYLAEYVEIYDPTAEELDMFREATQEPVIEFIKEDVQDPEWVQKILDAAQEMGEYLGYY